MIVYRLQDVEGNGPFNSDSYLGGYIRNHNEPCQMGRSGQATHSYEHICGRLGMSEYVFAWNSWERMADFMRFPINADRAGYRVVIFDVADDSIVFHDGQVLFDRNAAVIKDSCLLTKIFEHCA